MTKKTCVYCKHWDSDDDGNYGGDCKGACGVIRSYYDFVCPDWEAKPASTPHQTCLNCRRYHKLMCGHYCDSPNSAFFGWNDSAQGCNDWEAKPEPESKPDGLQMTPGEREDALTKYMYRSLGIPWVEPEPEPKKTCLNCESYFRKNETNLCVNTKYRWIALSSTIACRHWEKLEET